MNSVSIDILQSALLEVTATPMEEPALLREIREETNRHLLYARMVCGNEVMNTLRIIIETLQPSMVLEIGTFVGYSAIGMAMHLSEGAEIITLDCNDEIIPIARRHIETSGLATKIRLIEGDAKSIIPTLNEGFDLVFMDGDKREYSDYFRSVSGCLAEGGILIVDDIDQAVLQDFKQMLLLHPDFHSLYLPLRHGLLIAQKNRS